MRKIKVGDWVIFKNNNNIGVISKIEKKFDELTVTIKYINGIKRDASGWMFVGAFTTNCELL